MTKTMREDILKDYFDKFPTLYSSCDGREGYDADVTKEVKDFLSQVIDRVQLELLEEIKKELEKYKGNDTNDFIGGGNYVVENFGEDIDSKILSIKEEMNDKTKTK